MRFVFPTTFAIIGLLSVPLAAQEDLSVDELTKLFQRQKAAFSEATSNGLGQTRGLKLITVEDAEAPQEAGNTTLTAQTDTGSATTDANKPLVATPVVFGQLDPDLQVNLQITFGFDSAALSQAEKPKLDKMCLVLKQSDLNLVRIVGHTDASGSAEYNEKLSSLRAKEVARHLIESCGIAPERLQTIGLGERFPANKNDSRADENRRVEFQALS
ncbi:OmpA family protein [Lentibacter algarum]|uniref:OmpA family protein n=1 Tax=Lentibacter algarum TaxID=576131 RepID=UPI001C07652A|nr:OmpA family protein [Lentibacter algarum]MBU2980578.1 OmpA family protein [Lentibacter algarum]